MKSKIIFNLMIIILLCTVFCVPDYKDVASYVWQTDRAPVIVLDPGHGGMDGGAVSRDGTNEKDINLAIVLELKQRLEKEDVRVILTRESDKGLYDESQGGAVRSLKTQDMKERKRIIDGSNADLTVSIHLNSFTQDASVKGAQVFYPSYENNESAENSREAAKIIQKKLNDEINVDKKRTELGKNDVFLLKNVISPIVIVECGFLSNPEDASNLKEKSFRARFPRIYVAVYAIIYLFNSEQKIKTLEF